MSILHPYLRQHLRQVAFRATRPADFDDTLIVDAAGQPKGDEIFAAGHADLTRAAVLWLLVSVASVLCIALIINITWTDVIGWLADAGDTLMRHRAGVVIAVPGTVLLRFANPSARRAGQPMPFTEARPADLLSVRADGMLRVRLWGRHQPQFVHPASLTAAGERDE